MKKILISIAAIAAVALSSCNGAGTLAREVEGTWSGVPVKFVDESASSAVIIENLIFTTDSTGMGGSLIISGLISTTAQVQGTQAIVQPFSLSASAKSMATATWRAVDEDEIDVTVDAGSVSVTVDPQAIELTSNVMTGATAPEQTALKPQLAASMKSQLTNALVVRYAAMNKLDDVKVKGNVMKYEVADVDYTFSRQGQ